MTTAGSEGEAGAVAPSLDALAAGVAAEAKGPEVPETTAALVVAALRRRAEGTSYAAIGRELGVPAKRVSQWCRTAAEAAPASPVAAVAEAADAKRKRPRAVTRSAPVAARFTPRTYERLRERAGGAPVSSVVVAAVESYLSTVPVDTEQVLSDERRRLLSDGLIATANALGGVEQQLRVIGRLENQLVRFAIGHTGGASDLPVDLGVALAQQRDALAAVAVELAAVRASVDRIAEVG